ncbi:hypothetical protein D3C86_2074840 [compost metagenome]
MPKLAIAPNNITKVARGIPATPLLVSISNNTIVNCWPIDISVPVACATNTVARARYKVEPSRLKL